jgi:hypothetical protein
MSFTMGAAPLAIAEEAGNQAKVSVHGSCQTIVQRGVSSSDTCNFNSAGVATDTVPEGKQLVIKHVSGTCTGPLEGEIAFLILQTQNAPGASSQPAFLPLVKRPARLGFASRYTASTPVRLYTAARTQVGITILLESEFPNYQPTSCDVRFQGHLLDVQVR